MGTLKVSVNTNYGSFVGELINKFPFPKLGDTCSIINK
jgi:hypothetical protein